MTAREHICRLLTQSHLPAFRFNNQLTYEAIIGDLSVILKLPRNVVQSLAKFSEEEWIDSKGGRAKLLLAACLRAIAYRQCRCGKGCGVSFSETVSKDDYFLEFHHVDDGRTKYFELKPMDRLPSFILVAELRKCVAICSNCHRCVTWGSGD